MRIGTVAGALAAAVSLVWFVLSVYPREASHAAVAARPPAPAAVARAAENTQAAVVSTPAIATPRPKPKPNPCAGNQDQEVLVSIAQQRVWLCNGSVSDAEYLVTTGKTGSDTETPTGDYEVQALTRDTTLNPDSGGAFPVKYWIPFKWGMFGFHDAPWQQIPFGSQQYAQDGSQGCVHMQTADIAHLFSWVHLGTRVVVR